MLVMLGVGEQEGLRLLLGFILFSFCLRLQNHTRTTSFSSCRLSANAVISCAEGFGFCWGAIKLI